MPEGTGASGRIGFAFDRDFFESGYIQIENSTTNDAGLSDSAYRTLLVIRQFAWKTGECWPGITRLAKMRGKSNVSIMTHIAELTERGYLEKKRRGQGKTNLYIIKTPEPVVSTCRDQENLSSKTPVNLSERLSSLRTPASASISDAGVSPTEKLASVSKEHMSKERIMEILNRFRDFHLEYTKTRYMISWARDSKLAKEMLNTYGPDIIRDMMKVFFTQPHRQYSMPFFHRAIPEIVLIIEDIRKKELRQNKLLAEANAFERYSKAHAAATLEQKTLLTSYETQIVEITSEGTQAVISNPILREKLTGVQEKTLTVWEDIHLRAVAVSGLPRDLRAELEKLMQYDVSKARDTAMQLVESRRRKGGDTEHESDPKIPP